ncbi:MAG: tRNA (adenosine(37)-N6)-threonylcarbamoyltransferase complex dimerization subunit type 1 TsaB [Burkholderiales bacterium]|nr:tRNA (adenosine(37)-N6)-threonylcarbamoyltransferase complex dimerization subunit type 1 TsaB [Burkholderiales bacterium]
MAILAIETSTGYLSVAVLNEDRLVVRDCLAGQKHSELILPMIADALAGAAVERKSIRAIAFGAGPGSFTGLRIACGVAQGLAFGLAVPVIPVSTLEAVAEANGGERVAVALDARMGEIYFAAFERDRENWKVVLDGQLCRPDALPPLPGHGWCGAGSGFAMYGQTLLYRYQDQLADVDYDAAPHARTIARLAWLRYQDGKAVPAAEALPIYIRNKVALTVDEQAVGR